MINFESNVVKMALLFEVFFAEFVLDKVFECPENCTKIEYSLNYKVLKTAGMSKLQRRSNTLLLRS